MSHTDEFQPDSLLNMPSIHSYQIVAKNDIQEEKKTD